MSDVQYGSFAYLLGQYGFEFKEIENSDYYAPNQNINGYNVLLKPFYQLRIGNIRSGVIIQAADWTGIRAKTAAYPNPDASFYQAVSYGRAFPSVRWSNDIGLSLHCLQLSVFNSSGGEKNYHFCAHNWLQIAL